MHNLELGPRMLYAVFSIVELEPRPSRSISHACHLQHFEAPTSNFTLQHTWTFYCFMTHVHHCEARAFHFAWYWQHFGADNSQCTWCCQMRATFLTYTFQFAWHHLGSKTICLLLLQHLWWWLLFLLFVGTLVVTPILRGVLEGCH